MAEGDLMVSTVALDLNDTSSNPVLRFHLFGLHYLHQYSIFLWLVIASKIDFSPNSSIYPDGFVPDVSNPIIMEIPVLIQTL